MLSALAFFLWRHKSRRRKCVSGTRLSSSVSLDQIPPGITEKPELDSKMVPSLSTNPSELQGERDIAEMAVPQIVAELPGSMPSWFQGRGESEEWSVSPVDTATVTGSVAEPSPLSERSGSHRRRSSFSKSFKVSPIL